MKEQGIRLLLWTGVLSMMAVIFIFSAQPGAESDMLTQAAAMPIAELIAAAKNGVDEAFVLHIYHILGTLLRKAAHVAEYAILGLMLRLLCRRYGIVRIWLPLLCGIAYGASDEIHQIFVPGRLGAFSDVLIDSLGVLIGVSLVSVAVRIRRKHCAHHQ